MLSADQWHQVALSSDAQKLTTYTTPALYHFKIQAEGITTTTTTTSSSSSSS
jgi:hypothetical protein